MDPPSIPFLVNFLAGFLLLLITFGGMWALGFRLGAGISALCLAVMPGFVILSRSPMSEIPSMVLVFSGFFLLAFGHKSEQLYPGVVGSALIGLSIWLRVSNCFLGIAPILFALVLDRASWKTRTSWASSYSAALIVSASPVLIYNWIQFGNPLTTGYNIWIPRTADFGYVFNTAYLFRNLSGFWNDVTQNEVRFTMANLYGNGSYIGPAFLPLSMLAIAVLFKRRLFQPFILSSLFFSAIMMFYEFESVRLFMPALFLLAPVIGGAFDELSPLGQSGDSRKQRVLFGVIVLLFAAHLLGVPGKVRTLELAETVDVSEISREPEAYETVDAARSYLNTESPKLILTSWNPPYVYSLTRGDRIVSPLTWQHRYRFNKDYFVYGEKEIERDIACFLSNEATVYALVSIRDFGNLKELRPAPPGYH